MYTSYIDMYMYVVVALGSLSVLASILLSPIGALER